MKTRFQLGETVYHKLAPDDKGIVTGICLRPGHTQYFVTWADKTETIHFEMELTDDPYSQ